jgi:trigger factor
MLRYLATLHTLTSHSMVKRSKKYRQLLVIDRLTHRASACKLRRPAYWGSIQDKLLIFQEKVETMKATVEKINTVQRRVTVTVPATTVNAAFEAIYHRLQKKAKIQGFRPGKAPMNIIKRSYGASVAGEVGEKLINESLFGAMKDHDVRAISSPMVEAKAVPTANAEYEFSAVIDVMPSIELKGHKGLTFACKEYSVGSESIGRELELLARRQAKTATLPEGVTAGLGHLGLISHTASAAGEDLAEMNVKKIPVAFGRKEIFPELEAGILGMKKGEQKTVKFTLPKDFGDAGLANKAIEFNVTVDDLMALELPTVDDEFAKDMNFESLAALTQRIGDDLQETAKNMRNRDIEQAIMDALRIQNDFEVPPSMVDQVIDGMISEMGIRDEKMKKMALVDAEFRKNLREEAKRRAQNTILLWEVAKTENIEIKDDDIKNHIRSLIPAETAGAEKQIEATFQSAGGRVRENLLLERAMGLIISAATIANIPTEI